jgi:hypothetical protein
MYTTRFKYRKCLEQHLFREYELRQTRNDLEARKLRADLPDVMNYAIVDTLDRVDKFIREAVYYSTDLDKHSITIEELDVAKNMYPNLNIRQKLDNAYELFEALRPEHRALVDHVDLLEHGLIKSRTNNFITKLKDMTT